MGVATICVNIVTARVTLCSFTNLYVIPRGRPLQPRLSGPGHMLPSTVQFSALRISHFVMKRLKGFDQHADRC